MASSCLVVTGTAPTDSPVDQNLVYGYGPPAPGITSGRPREAPAGRRDLTQAPHGSACVPAPDDVLAFLSAHPPRSASPGLRRGWRRRCRQTCGDERVNGGEISGGRVVEDYPAHTDAQAWPQSPLTLGS